MVDNKLLSIYLNIVIVSTMQMSQNAYRTWTVDTWPISTLLSAAFLDMDVSLSFCFKSTCDGRGSACTCEMEYAYDGIALMCQQLAYSLKHIACRLDGCRHSKWTTMYHTLTHAGNTHHLTMDGKFLNKTLICHGTVSELPETSTRTNVQ